METELQQAERIARGWVDSLTPVGDLARVFLAQQARLAEVERERDRLARDLSLTEAYRDHWIRECHEVSDALAAAERKATEAAREALTRFVKERREGTASDAQWDMLCDLERFRDREYPAPTEREGARTQKREPWPSVVGWPYSCDKCGEKGECFTGCGLAECDAVAIRDNRPTPPQAAPEQVVLYANVDGERKHIRLTPEDCRRVVETGRASGRGE